MSNRNRSKSNSVISFSSNLIIPDDYIDFSAEELVALCNALSCAIAGVEDFINSNPPADKLKEANEDFATWNSLFDKIENYLDSLDE